MSGGRSGQSSAFSYVSLESHIPKGHPIRSIKKVDRALKMMDGEFDAMHTATGRASIPPECLLWALILQVVYSIRSERQLMERLGRDLLFKWFVGLEIDGPVWCPTTSRTTTTSCSAIASTSASSPP